MSERSPSTSVGSGTAEIPVVRPGTPTPSPAAEEPIAQSAEEPGAPGEVVPGLQSTSPVTVRPRPRMPRRSPLTVMGPWAPVAGGLLGLLLGGVAALILKGSAESFEDRFALVLTVLGLGMLGSAGILLADEVRMMRQSARDAEIRPAWAETTAGLLNGLTPARLLLLLSGFVLFLAVYVSR